MHKLTMIYGPGVAAIVLAWSVSAHAQSATIELIEANLAARAHEAPAARGGIASASLRHSGDSVLRMATRSSGAMQVRDRLQARAASARRGSGASAGARCQSEVAEHRQERRGATSGAGSAGKASGSNSAKGGQN